MKTLVTVRRTNGTTETLDMSINFPYGMSQAEYRKMQDMTRKAGRGEVLSCNNLRGLPQAPRADLEILTDERRGLVADAREAAENASKALTFNGGIYYQARKATADKALAALAAFDAKHPEVIGQISAIEAEAGKEAYESGLNR